MPSSSRTTAKRRSARLTAFIGIAVLALSSPSGVDAEYFSKGWDPSAPTQKAVRPNSQGFNPNAPAGRDIHPPTGADTAWKLPDLDLGDKAAQGTENIKQGARAVRSAAASPPSGRLPSLTSVLSNKFQDLTGFNVTAAYERAEEAERFSRVNDTIEGIVRLEDGNWQEEVVEEDFGEDGISEDNRVWMMLLHGPPRDISSVLFNQAITNASLHRQAQSELLPEGEIDMPEVKFAKMDFMTESLIPTQWLVFRPPQLVFITKRGSELRFLGTRNIRADTDIFYRMMKEEAWKEVPVWESSFGPSGSNAWMVHVFHFLNSKWTLLTNRVPSWAIAIITGLLSQQVIAWLHKADPKKKEAEAKQAALKRGITRAAELKAAGEKKALEEVKEQELAKGGKGSLIKKKAGKGSARKDAVTSDGVEVTVEKKNI